MPIVSAQLMSEYSVEFSLGADILGKGNRSVEKHLGASNLSGDTVNVSITDSGVVLRDMDITSHKGTLGVNRSSVPVKVSPIVVAAEVSIEDLTQSIQNPEVMAKRVANYVDAVNTDAYNGLLGGSQAYVADTAGTEDIKKAMYDALAGTQGSKLAGNTYGVIHPQTWNRVVPALAGNFGGNGNLGSNLYRNELGDFLGFQWTKGASQTRVTGAAISISPFTIGTDGFVSGGITATGLNANPVDGELSQPIVLVSSNNSEPIYNVDALGKSTGIIKTFYLKYDAETSSWNLAYPVFFEGPRQNAYCEDYTAGDHSLDIGTNADVLANNVEYLAPCVIWKEPDFLVAVKGLEAYNGTDSFTVPTKYKDKGILPLRGTAWTDAYSATTLFRVDALFGFNLYQGVSVTSAYIPV